MAEDLAFSSLDGEEKKEGWPLTAAASLFALLLFDLVRQQQLTTDFTLTSLSCTFSRCSVSQKERSSLSLLLLVCLTIFLFSEILKDNS